MTVEANSIAPIHQRKEGMAWLGVGFPAVAMGSGWETG
jgi:hypothetical protein